MFEKINHFESNKNYQLVGYVLSNVKIEKLSDDIDAKK